MTANLPSTTTLDEIIDEYESSWYDRLTKFVRLATEKLEQGIAEREIKARVSSRVKNPGSLRKKLESWLSTSAKASRIKDPRSTLEQVNDLAALRVMTYTEHGRAEVVELIKAIFRSPDGKHDFDMEIKEQRDLRIKDDPVNHYRATHMLIALRQQDIEHSIYRNLKQDVAEIQITSMLAHVWNEIEHDTIYKAKASTLLAEERRSLDSLGMLTKTGDNIIKNFLAAQDRRTYETSEKLVSANDLSEFLAAYYGPSFGTVKIDYNEGIKELFELLQALKLDSPQAVMGAFYPATFTKVLQLSREIRRYENKHDIKQGRLRDGSCDLFILSLFMTQGDLLQDYLNSLHGKKRLARLFRAFEGCRE